MKPLHNNLAITYDSNIYHGNPNGENQLSVGISIFLSPEQIKYISTIRFREAIGEPKGPKP